MTHDSSWNSQHPSATELGSGIESATDTLQYVDTIFGRIECFQNDLITDQLLSFGAHTRPELAFLLSVVDPGDRIFDIGGHIGTFAVPLAQRSGVKHGTVIVEALRSTYAVLTRNVERCCQDLEVVTLNALIGRKGSSYEARAVRGNTGASHFVDVQHADNMTPITTIDDLARQYFIPRVIKIDIEGYEGHALADATYALKTNPILYVEINRAALERCGSSVVSVDDLLRSLGYRLFKNMGDRNGAHDNYRAQEIATLSEGGNFFDVLAIHADDNRLRRLKP